MKAPVWAVFVVFRLGLQRYFLICFQTKHFEIFFSSNVQLKLHSFESGRKDTEVFWILASVGGFILKNKFCANAMIHIYI